MLTLLYCYALLTACLTVYEAIVLWRGGRCPAPAVAPTALM